MLKTSLNSREARNYNFRLRKQVKVIVTSTRVPPQMHAYSLREFSLLELEMEETFIEWLGERGVTIASLFPS